MAKITDADMERALRSWRKRNHYYVAEGRENVLRLAQRFSRTLVGFPASEFEAALKRQGIVPKHDGWDFWSLVCAK